MHTSQKLTEADLNSAIASTQECRQVAQPLGADGMPQVRGWYFWVCAAVIGLTTAASVYLPYGWALH